MIGDSLKQRLQQVRTDERAVSPVVGFVLIFAFAIILLTLYQTNVVPANNQEVEYEQSQDILTQMEQLDSALVTTVTSQYPQSVTLQTGVQYPSRLLAINPGNPVGSLRSESNYEVELSGINPSYGDGSETYDTAFINYNPNYNRLNEETQISIEHGMVIQDYSQSTNTRLATEGPLLPPSGDRVNLLLLDSGLSRSEMTTTVTTERVDNRTIKTGEESATLRLPTTLSESAWNDYVDGKPQVADWDYYTDSGTTYVDLILAEGTTIQMNKIVAGEPEEDDSTIDTTPYLENVTPLQPNLDYDETAKMTVRAIDQFGSPLPGIEVSQSQTGGAETVSPSSATTNGTGMATFTYDPAIEDLGESLTVTATLPDVAHDDAEEQFQLEYPDVYIENITSRSRDLSSDESATLAVRTYSSGGDDLSDIDITTSTTGGGSVTNAERNPDDNATATFTYDPAPGETGTVEVTASLPDVNNENDSVSFELNYPANSGGGGGDYGDQISFSRGSLEEGPTDLIFRITPSPVEIAGFSVTTQSDLEDITQTEPTHGFFIYTARNAEGRNGLQYPRESQSGPIIFDGTRYDFADGPGRVQSSIVQLNKFDWSDQITFEDFVDSPANADIIVTFYLENGEKRSAFIDASRGG